MEETIADLITKARRDAGLTQGALAGRVGVSLGLVDRWERGEAHPGDRIEAIAEATGKTPSWFTGAAEDDATKATLVVIERVEHELRELKATVADRLEELERRVASLERDAVRTRKPT